MVTDRQKVERVRRQPDRQRLKFTQRGGVRLELVHTEERTTHGPRRGHRHRRPEQNAPHLLRRVLPGGQPSARPQQGFGWGWPSAELAQQLGGDVRLAGSGHGGSCSSSSSVGPADVNPGVGAEGRRRVNPDIDSDADIVVKAGPTVLVVEDDRSAQEGDRAGSSAETRLCGI